MARIISGEEEAIYSWAAVNFLMGSLLPNSLGTGAALEIGENLTFGTLDLGGASSQIAFFVPSQVWLVFIIQFACIFISFRVLWQDISEGLFKLQIGGQKHWNVYTKSFLQFGQTSARLRHVTGLADTAARGVEPNSAAVPTSLNYCFFAGYSEKVFSTPFGNMTSPLGALLSGPPVPAQDQFSRCLDTIRPLLVKYNNDYCNVVYNGQCSINGAYMPSVSDSYVGNRRFIGTSSYRYPWRILLLPETATLTEYRSRAEKICAMSFRDVIHYSEVNNLNSFEDRLGDRICNWCFLVSYTYALLVEGYGFRPDQSITVLDQVRGNKVGWPLGAILYELNTMPWVYEPDITTADHWMAAVVMLIIGIHNPLSIRVSPPIIIIIIIVVIIIVIIAIIVILLLFL